MKFCAFFVNVKHSYAMQVISSGWLGVWFAPATMWITYLRVSEEFTVFANFKANTTQPNEEKRDGVSRLYIIWKAITDPSDLAGTKFLYYLRNTEKIILARGGQSS